jgi:catechol 2,3-dioxygenase-like lactoylglutathione lyase family enzyme
MPCSYQRRRAYRRGRVLTRLDHIVIAVADLQTASTTYAALLGRAPSWRGTHPHYGTANTLFRLANTYVELLAPAGEGPVGDVLSRKLAAEGEGPFALAFGTDDSRATASELRARGLTITEPAEGVGKNIDTGAERRWSSFHVDPTNTRGIRLLVAQHLDTPDALPRSTPNAETAGVVDAVDHVVVMTGDADAAIGLYGDKLGLRLALDRTFESRGLRLLFFRIGHLTVECAAALGGGNEVLHRDATAAGACGMDRFWGISYRVTDVDAARARLSQASFDVSDTRKGMKPGTRVCTVRSETHGVATLLLGPE